MMKKKIRVILFFMVLFVLTAFSPQKNNKENEEYSVAAYVWPSCHDELMSRETLWNEGIGEWEIIKKGNHVSKFIGILFHRLFIKTEMLKSGDKRIFLKFKLYSIAR